MTKKDLHAQLRGLKKQIQEVQNFTDYLTVSIQGQLITKAIYAKGYSTTDLKIMLSWERTKDAARARVTSKAAA